MTTASYSAGDRDSISMSTRLLRHLLLIAQTIITEKIKTTTPVPPRITYIKDFDDLWEQIDEQVPPSSRPPCPESPTPKSEAKTEETSVLRTLLNNTQPASEIKIKKDREVKTEIPFKRYTSSSPSSTTTTSCTYSPPLDENWPHASSAPFTNVEDSILTTFRRKSPKKYEALNRRFTEPRVTATREVKVLKALQKRIMQDMEQSEIIVNYLTDKYGGDEPEKKRAKFISLR
uniref:Uncharacterized protein n=1 Tax=Magallana gigas TaxID=29159 RepID=A0A8W8MPV4_MAGGI